MIFSATKKIGFGNLKTSKHGKVVVDDSGNFEFVPEGIEYKDGRYFEKPKETVAQKEVKVEPALLPSLSVLPLPTTQVKQEPISWRVCGGWLLAGFSWAFFITYVLLGVIMK